MKFEIYMSEKGAKRVKFECGQDYCVHTDGSGREYFDIPNPYVSSKNPLDYMFIGKIKDAYNSIKDGHGDAIKKALFGSDTVVYYLDRKYGEKIREQFLAGWEDAVFGYSLQFGCGYSGYKFISDTPDRKIKTVFDKELQPLFFKTEEEAIEEKNRLETSARTIAERLNNCDSKEAKKEYLDSLKIDQLKADVELALEKEFNIKVVQHFTRK